MTEIVEGGVTIGAAQAVDIYRRLTWTRLRRGRLRWVVLALLALPVLGAITMEIVSHAGATGSLSVDLFDNILQLHRFLVLFLPALATSSIVAEEIEGKTFTFLFVRPAPRWTLPVGKYLASMLPLCVLFAASILLTYCVALLIPPAGPSEFVEYLPRLARAILATTLGVLAVGALATMLGAWFTRYPFVMVMSILLITEGLFNVASLPIGSISWHMKNIVRPERAAMIFSEIDVPVWVSMATLSVLTLLGLSLAAVSVAGAEYRTDR